MKIKNIGVTFDQILSMQAHENTIAKNCYYLRNIARIRRMLHISQRVQNYAARLILRFGKSEHITPLHWLPVELRVDYKMLLYNYTYKAFYNHAPPYICDIV